MLESTLAWQIATTGRKQESRSKASQTCRRQATAKRAVLTRQFERVVDFMLHPSAQKHPHKEEPIASVKTNARSSAPHGRQTCWMQDVRGTKDLGSVPRVLQSRLLFTDPRQMVHCTARAADGLPHICTHKIHTLQSRYTTYESRSRHLLGGSALCLVCQRVALRSAPTRCAWLRSSCHCGRPRDAL